MGSLTEKEREKRNRFEKLTSDEWEREYLYLDAWWRIQNRINNLEEKIESISDQEIKFKIRKEIEELERAADQIWKKWQIKSRENDLVWEELFPELEEDLREMEQL